MLAPSVKGLLAPSVKGLQRLLDASYTYECDNDILFNSQKSQVMFLDTMKSGHVANIMLGEITLNVTKSYKYHGHIINDNMCDEVDIKAKVRGLYFMAGAMFYFTKCYFCSEHVKNKLFTCYCSNLCSLWDKYRKSSMKHFVVIK